MAIRNVERCIASFCHGNYMQPFWCSALPTTSHQKPHTSAVGEIIGEQQLIAVNFVNLVKGRENLARGYRGFRVA